MNRIIWADCNASGGLYLNGWQGDDDTEVVLLEPAQLVNKTLCNQYAYALYCPIDVTHLYCHELISYDDGHCCSQRDGPLDVTHSPTPEMDLWML
jgi:hypothetical protein